MRGSEHHFIGGSTYFFGGVLSRRETGSDFYLRKIPLAAVGHPRDEGLMLGLLFLIPLNVSPRSTREISPRQVSHIMPTMSGRSREKSGRQEVS